MPHATFESTTAGQVIFTAVLFVFGLSPLDGFQQKRTEWQRVKVQDLLTFQLPPGWTKSAANRSDLREEWTKGNAKLLYIRGETNSGEYSDRRRSWMDDYQEATTRVGGRKANVRSYSFIKDEKRRYVAELNVGNWDRNQIEFFMHIEGRDVATIKLAKKIFESVKISLPAPERATPE
jgi:hypothetical protein